MQRLKTSLKRFLWVIGILFGVVYLLFILSYFVFFVWLPSRSHEGELRAVQSKDKPYLAGVEALPQNALIYISEDTAAPELLIAEDLLNQLTMKLRLICPKHTLLTDNRV